MRLRALIPALLLAALPLGVHAQEGLFIRAGLNMAYAPLDSLNGVLTRYNARSNPTNAFPDIHLAPGPTVSIGYSGSSITGAVEYTGRYGQSTARHIPSAGPESRTQVRYAASTVDISFALRVSDIVSVGLSADMGGLKTRIRRLTTGQPSPSTFYDASKGLTLGSSLFLQMDLPVHERVSIGLRPYFHYNFIRADFSNLNSALNPTTFQSDPLFILGNTANVGLKLTAMVGLW